MRKISIVLFASCLTLAACSREEGFSKEYHYHDKPPCHLSDGELVASLSDLDKQASLRGAEWDGNTYLVQMPADKELHDIMQRIVWDSTELRLRKSTYLGSEIYVARGQAILNKKNDIIVRGVSERDSRCQ